MWKYVPFLKIFFPKIYSNICENQGMNYSLKVSKSVDLQVVSSVFPPHLTLPPSIDSRHPLCVRHCRVLAMSRWMRQPWTLLSQSPALKGLVPSPQALIIQCERCILNGEVHSSVGAQSGVHRVAQPSLGCRGTEPALGWGCQVPRPHHLRRRSHLDANPAPTQRWVITSLNGVS